MPSPESDLLNPIKVFFVSTFSGKHGAAIGESLGVEVLAGHLLGEFGNSVNVDHVDLQLDPDINKLAECVEEKSPDILGISLKIGAVEQAQELMDAIRALSLTNEKQPIVVMGGAVPSFAALPLLKLFPDAIMARGEGESTIEALVEMIRGIVNLDQVPGITYLDGGGKVVETKKSHLSHRYFPARITTKRIMNELGGVVWAETSRGCDGYCTFCSVREIHNGGFSCESFPVESVVDELQGLSKLGVKIVSYTDDDFCGDQERALLIAEEIIERKLDIKFTISTRADHVWAEKLPKSAVDASLEEYNQRLRHIMATLYRAGLTRVFIGLESGSPSQLRRYGKQISVNGNYKAIEILREIGIDVAAGFIPIDHVMTLEELQESLEFLRRTGMYLKVTNPLSVMRAQEGSPYLSLLRKNGLLGQRTKDLVFYEAGFKDQRVKKVAGIADKWVNDIYEFIFGLKNEVAITTSDKRSNSSKPESAQKLLFDFRELEMEMIEAVTSTLLRDGEAEFKIEMESFLTSREDLIRKAREFASDGLLDRRNGRLIQAADNLLNHK